MARVRSPAERAAGRLIAAVQKEWHAQLGEPGAEVSEAAMENASALLGAVKDNSLHAVLRGQSVAEFIGILWVRKHPGVLPAIRAFEAAALEGHA